MKLQLTIYLLLSIVTSLLASDKNKTKSISSLKLEEDPIIVKFNRVTLSIAESGVIFGGLLDTNMVLYSSGFFMGGTNSSREFWSNGVFPTQRISSYIPGTVESGSNIQSLFYVSKQSTPFGIEWQNWREAVELGAEFYDGDNDGAYDPVDNNENGICDSDEDRPAIYGDIMIWSVFNDGAAESRQGINIRQTVWAEKNKPGLDKVVFIKYSIENSGEVSPSLNHVLFSLAVDPDLGLSHNDLLGCNPQINDAFTYYPFRDQYHNEESCSFITTMIQGPIINYKLHNFESMSYKLEGEEFTINKTKDSQNLNTSALHRIIGRLNVDDPQMLGRKMSGWDNPSPCSDNYGVVYNQDCASINSYQFQYSGNPIKKDGWVNTRKTDQQYLLTTSAFSLETGSTQDIIFAFIVGTGEDGTEALIDGQKLSKKVRYTYFDSPDVISVVQPTTITYDNTIELVWETANTFEYNSQGYGFNIDFEGYEVLMYKSPSALSEINDTKNSEVIARYDIANHYKRILIEDDEDYNSEMIYKDGIQLQPSIYDNHETGRIILKVNWDPFNNEPLRKGKPYYFSITPFGLDQSKLIEFDSRSSYIVPADNYFGYVKNEPQIINDNKGNVGIVIGENLNDSFYRGVPLEHVSGESEAEITYSIYDSESLTNDTYQMSFVKNEINTNYELYFDIQNITTGDYLAQGELFNDDFNNIQNLYDGFVINLDWVEPGSISYSFKGNDNWFKTFDGINSGIFYVGRDIEEKQTVFPVSDDLSIAISVDKLKKVELRFADSSKAYRYVRRAIRYLWQGMENIDSGYVNIPVSAYKVDRYGNSKKISIAFLENAFPFDSLGNSNGIWNPGSNVAGSKEYLAIFDAEYSDDPFKHIAYTGLGNREADIAHGYFDNQFPDSIKSIARSSWFDAMYIVGFETFNNQASFDPTGTFVIEPARILTPQDKFMWKVKTEKTIDERKAQFEKINIYPNPLFGYNSNSNAFGFDQDEPFITFSNLPEVVDISIYTLSGTLINTIQKNDASASYRWDLKNDYGNRIASGMYIALIEVPEFGQKVLKFGIIQPQKRVHFE